MLGKTLTRQSPEFQTRMKAVIRMLWSISIKTSRYDSGAYSRMQFLAVAAVSHSIGAHTEAL